MFLDLITVKDHTKAQLLSIIKYVTVQDAHECFFIPVRLILDLLMQIFDVEFL